MSLLLQRGVNVIAQETSKEKTVKSETDSSVVEYTNLILNGEKSTIIKFIYLNCLF